jgi:predicted  nucleic acid-binding Zn-ribbon protein
MKHALVTTAFFLACGSLASGQNSPAGNIKMVVQLMQSLSLDIANEGTLELASYDKYACWCEDTLARKAKDIANAKQQIDDLQVEIEKLSGEIGSHSAEIAHLEKLIAENKESQREATEVRDNENADFTKEKTEQEQCIGALEAAIGVLSGAGTGKKGFLETLQQAQVLSVVDGIKSVLQKATYSKFVSEKDLDFAREFFNKPGQSMFQHGMVAAQTGNNPFGDYAPQSDRIVGILKGLYDAFTQDLEKSNVEEAEAQKSYEEFMATKKAELKTLETTHDQQVLYKAEKEKKEAEAKQLRMDTKEQLAADEEFFATTKIGCQDKAKEWGERVRMRTQELQGINKAVEILSSPEATETFANSSAIALVQLKSIQHHVVTSQQVSSKNVAALQTLAKRFQSKQLSRIAAIAKAGGYFDEVIGSIDEMIVLLRREEKEDIAHRDRCEGAQNKNKIDSEDLQTTIDKADAKIKTMEHSEKQLTQDISTLEIDIKATENDLEQRLAMRNQEKRQFEKSLKDDQNAFNLVEKAIVTLMKFYDRNKIEMSGMVLAQKQPKEYTVDADKAPETVWDAKGASYSGRQSENVGIVAILKMIGEDIKHEMDKAREEDAANQEEYDKERGAMVKTRDAQLATKRATEKELAEMQGKILDTQEFRDGKDNELKAEGQLKTAIYADCSWVETEFDNRADARKKELDGLQAAKGYLAGVQDGTALAP